MCTIVLRNMTCVLQWVIRVFHMSVRELRLSATYSVISDNDLLQFAYFCLVVVRESLNQRLVAKRYVDFRFSRKAGVERACAIKDLLFAPFL